MMYECWLAEIRGISDRKKRMLRKAFGTGKAVYDRTGACSASMDFFTKKDIEILRQAKQQISPEEVRRAQERLGIRFIPFFSEEYPEKISKTADPPYALYVKGSLPPPGRKAVAIVGARRCTPYGEAMALEYGEELARFGAVVISGMARGIDGAGQRGALNGGGATYAVLGCGADVCYPREHAGLYADILKSGGILSELPPGAPPLPVHFPRRNRIISALSDVILVMEAEERSGSLITADLALEQGRDVYALPGLATSPMSRGCHRLIAQGAGILLSPRELIEELDIQIVKLCKNKEKSKEENKKVLETTENMVYSCLGLLPQSVSELVAATELSAQELLRILAYLEIKGLVREVSKNYYIKARK